jgi:hypothetical protein
MKYRSMIFSDEQKLDALVQTGNTKLCSTTVWPMDDVLR